MPPDRALAYLVFTIWVSICAFAPEFIWQGFVLLRDHFGAPQAYSALFIGALFAFFVEPLVERLKARRWRLQHEHARSLLVSAGVALVFGLAVVCLHEAIGAYLRHGVEGGHERASLAQAIDEAFEWASIPAAVTVAWFVAGTWRRAAVPAGVLVCAWIVGVGFFYEWGLLTVITTAIPSWIIVVLGLRIVLRRWDADTFARLAICMAGVAAIWLVLAELAQAVATSVGGEELAFYPAEEFYDDLRFYLGWALGLSVAPNPLNEA